MNPSDPDRVKQMEASLEEMKKSQKSGVNPANGAGGEMMKSSLMFTQHYTVSFTVAAITLVSIGIFGYGGYLLDEVIGSYPTFSISGLIISFPFSIYGIYKWVQTRYIPRLKKMK